MSRLANPNCRAAPDSGVARRRGAAASRRSLSTPALLLPVVLLLACPPGATGAPPFEAAFLAFPTSDGPDAGTGEGAGAVALGDLDADGHLDVAAVGGTRSVRVLLGAGDGMMRDRLDLATAEPVHAVAVVDLDQDGTPDLVAASADSAYLCVFLGTGGGGFAPRIDRVIGGGASALVVADLTFDDFPDVALALPSRDAVSVLLGLGNGTFDDAGEFPVGTRPLALAAGDVNRDGVGDLAVACFGLPPLFGGTVSVFIGGGDGAFELASEVGSGMGTRAVALGDLNEDGRADLAVVNGGAECSTGGEAAVFPGLGDGTFGVGTFQAQTEIQPRHLLATDVDGDGHLDLAVAATGGCGLGSGGIQVIRGLGGSFAEATPTAATARNPRYLAGGDLDHDGDADLVAASPGVRAVSVVLGNGDAAFRQAARHRVPRGPRATAIGDVNADGRPDIVTVSSHYPEPDSVTVLLSRGGRRFERAGGLPAGAGVTGVAVADLDGDGLDDVLVCRDLSATGGLDAGVVAVFRSAGSGALAPLAQYPVGTAPGALVAADFDGDGRMDAATADEGSTTVSVLFSRGDGTLAPAARVPVGWNPRGLVAADVNADGLPDLLTFVPDPEGGLILSRLVILRATSTGAFSLLGIFVDVPNPNALAAGDWDGDGIVDVAVPGQQPDQTVVLLGDGAAGFHPGEAFVGSPAPLSTVAADLDGDGHVDLATADPIVNATLLYRGNGDGTFVPWCGLGSAQFPIHVTAGDLDGGGRPDLIVADASGESVGVLWSTADVPPAPPSPPARSALAPNRPNPIRSSTRIPYDLAEQGRVAVRVHDPSGRLVRTLLRETKPAGRYVADWDGRDDAGRPVASGIYFCAVTYPDGATRSRKMTLAR